MNGFTWILGWKQYHHGDDACAKKDENKSAQEFRQQLGS
jgi:hypothetical protein